MLPQLRAFFNQHINREHEAGASDPEHDIRLATAALLLEVGKADFSMSEQESRHIADLVETLFELEAHETETLLQLAEEEIQDATSLHAFTSLINEHWTATDKIKIMEHLWAVAYADGELDKHERHLLRKLAGLLYIPQNDYIATKIRAEHKSKAQ
ncbi:MAG: TerB family tellurite resistance protein [Gammaproteobacteria bacterium]|nr:TerB family tellurite resistance protein [Gammaproteobacteria bacterium]